MQVVAIDPHGGGDRGPQEITPDAERGNEDNQVFRANLERRRRRTGACATCG